jgi:hypothetical protein
MVAVQTGDYALRGEFFHEKQLVLEVWGYVGIIKV